MPSLQSILKKYKSVTSRNKNREKELLRLMKTIKKTMQLQRREPKGIGDIKFTVGLKETSAFQAENESRRAGGDSYFVRVKKVSANLSRHLLRPNSSIEISLIIFDLPCRQDLGSKNELVVIWYRLVTDKDEFMTDLKLGSTNPNNKHFFFGEKEGYKPILHSRMRGMMLSEPNLILWVKKEAGQIRHISDIQVSHHKEDEMNLQRRNYEMLPLCLSKFGCGYGSKIWLLWTASSNILRLTDCEHIQKELTEYTEMLSKSPDDPILRKMVDTSQFRLKEAQLREEERARDIPGDDLVYTKDFLALQSHELKKMRTVFKRSIDLDNDGKVSVEDFATFLREPYMSAFLREIFELAVSSGNVNTHSDSIKTPIFSLGSTLKTVAVFCMLSSVEVVKFIFSCFDKKGCGWIDRAAFLGSLEMLHSKHRDDRVISALKEINLPEGGSLKFAQFEGKKVLYVYIIYIYLEGFLYDLHS